MDKILDAMDKALTKAQKEFHVFVVDRKIRKFEKKKWRRRLPMLATGLKRSCPKLIERLS